jgi:transposase-like protein
MDNVLNLNMIAQEFSNEDRAREFMEYLRWPNGTICPHCGAEGAYRLNGKPGSKRPVRKGVWKCKECRKQFTVKVGTIFEDSHIPLGKWLLAIHLLCSSKKGMSAHQLHRMLGMQYKSAWFMAHRIRHAMTQEPLASKLQGTVECDETYIGGKAKNMHRRDRARKIQGRGPVNKTPVMTLVERDGRVRSSQLERVTESNLKSALRCHVDPCANIMTDESPAYSGVELEFGSHEAVNHSAGEYVRGNAHVNTAESFHALLNRGVMGVYHHWSIKHMHRYLTEFGFRFDRRKDMDGDRTVDAIRAAEGKRLMYREPIGKSSQ